MVPAWKKTLLAMKIVDNRTRANHEINRSNLHQRRDAWMEGAAHWEGIQFTLRFPAPPTAPASYSTGEAAGKGHCHPMEEKEKKVRGEREIGGVSNS